MKKSILCKDAQLKDARIYEIVEKLKKEYNPLKVILFGSYAHDNVTDDSDIDLFILKNTDESRVDRFVRVKRIVYDPNQTVPVSPLVCTPDEVETRLKMDDNFIEEILHEGVVLIEKGS
jgi:predicted nucleotidyltransferase